jgi:hypothetical protein
LSTEKLDDAMQGYVSTPSVDFAPSVESIGDRNEYFFENFQNAFDKSSKTFDGNCEGKYEKILAKDISQYFPEGLAGETEQEFKFCKSRSWMIRDGTKILYRIIDDHMSVLEAKLYNLPEPIFSSYSETTHPSVELPGLTDRPTIRSSVIQAQIYGKEIFNEIEPLVKLRGESPQPKTSHKLIENYMNSIKKANSDELPRIIFLSGIFC